MKSQMQRGFTLVEIAIVLVIVGLLLGGVLKGQEMIENGKIKAATNDMNGIVAAYNGYLDRYKRLPGDEGPRNTLNARGGLWAALTVAPAASDGTITLAVADTFLNTNADYRAFWQALRAGGFLSGAVASTGTAALPVNPWGGYTGVTNEDIGAAPNVLGGVKVCMSRVPGKAAFAMDQTLDDGNGTTGSIRVSGVSGAGVHSAPASTTATPVDGNFYTVCRAQ